MSPDLFGDIMNTVTGISSKAYISILPAISTENKLLKRQYNYIYHDIYHFTSVSGLRHGLLLYTYSSVNIEMDDITPHKAL